METKVAVPTAISSLRIAALPLFIYFYTLGSVAACLALLVFCAATDYFDGYYARKLNATSKFGAYFDATTDFALMIGIFVLFSLEGFYPIWLVLVIVAAFSQFIVTSLFTKKFYDPVGRYLGSALYIGVVLTLLFPVQEIFSFVQYAFLGFFLVSLASRILSFRKKSKN
jgi:phosphatidylglycerophosphate synthase